MILAFKPQFKDKILNSTKIHTIREDSNRRWKAGRKIQMATGVRTKNYNCFKEVECVSVQEISIKYYKKLGVTNKVSIKVDGFDVPLNEISFNDGLSPSEFLNWFDKDFKGVIIHWTTKIYKPL